MTVPSDLHEYLAFEDPDEYRTWVFDVTFLTSDWTCIYGRGCPGIPDADESAEIGCCSYGAHFIDDSDHADTAAHIATLGPEVWQFHKVGAAKGATRQTADGTWVTRKHQGACIMLNRPDFPGGAGCALHRAALEAGDRPLDYKPDVCWQVPIRLEEHTDESGYVTSTVREWKRRDWGEGGAEFDWWCTDSPTAFCGSESVHLALEDELRELVGDAAYELLSEAISERETQRWTPVPHPARRQG